MPRSPQPLPVDPALSLAAALAEHNSLVSLASAAFGPTVTEVRVRYLEYRPGAWIRVQLGVQTPTGPGSALVCQYAQSPSPPAGTGIEAVIETAIARDPGAELVRVGNGEARVFRFPHDPGLPALRGHQGEVLAWVACQRAVLRQGPQIVKFHADPPSLQAAVAALRLVGTVLPTPAVLEVLDDDLAYVQTGIGGQPLTRRDASLTAGRAAALIRQLHDASLPGLVPTGPRQLLELCRPVASLVAWCQPELSGRVAQLWNRLEERCPAEGVTVPSHGDFNIGQLLSTASGELAVVDTDTLCSAPRALDLASYAANVISGRPADLADAEAILRRLVDGYGRSIEGEGHIDGEGHAEGGSNAQLRWYLAALVLRRLDRPIRRFKGDWPERTRRLLETAEGVAAAWG